MDFGWLLSNGPPPTSPPALQVLPKVTSGKESCWKTVGPGQAPLLHPPLSQGPNMNPACSLSFYPFSLFPDGPELEQFSTKFSEDFLQLGKRLPKVNKPMYPGAWREP